MTAISSYIGYSANEVIVIGLILVKETIHPTVPSGLCVYICLPYRLASLIHIIFPLGTHWTQTLHKFNLLINALIFISLVVMFEYYITAHCVGDLRLHEDKNTNKVCLRPLCP